MRAPPGYRHEGEGNFGLWHAIWWEGLKRIALVYDGVQFWLQWEDGREVKQRRSIDIAMVDSAIARGDREALKLNPEDMAYLAKHWPELLYRCTGLRRVKTTSVSVSGGSD